MKFDGFLVLMMLECKLFIMISCNDDAFYCGLNCLIIFFISGILLVFRVKAR